jgi:hypothetical protein
MRPILGLSIRSSLVGPSVRRSNYSTVNGSMPELSPVSVAASRHCLLSQWQHARTLSCLRGSMPALSPVSVAACPHSLLSQWQHARTLSCLSGSMPALYPVSVAAYQHSLLSQWQHTSTLSSLGAEPATASLFAIASLPGPPPPLGWRTRRLRGGRWGAWTCR